MKRNKLTNLLFIASSLSVLLISCNSTNTKEDIKVIELPKVSYVITDAMQTSCYDASGNVIDAPSKGELYYGQDAQYQGIIPSYSDNGDGTVTDNNTGLMWQQTPLQSKMTYDDALEYVENLELGGYTDWRLPTIKESFSIAMLDGKLNPEDTTLAIPYIDSDYFDFYYDEIKPYTGSYWTSTVCKMPANNDYEEMEKNYGFNWADGHLKSYGDGYNIDGSTTDHSIPAGVRAVRGEENVYGVNDFEDNNDGTISDNATNLMWSQQDSGWVNDDGSIRDINDDNYGNGRTWVDTLAWVEKMNEIEYLGYSDWRLPDIKELQSIVQYEKTELPATDPNFFNLSRPDCFVWSSTTCGDFPEMADYIAFGRGYGIDLATNSSEMTMPSLFPNTDFDSSSSSSDRPMGPPPGMEDSDRPMGPPPEMENSESSSTPSFNVEDATIEDFVDVHGPGCMRADYKDTSSVITQAPKLSRDFWSYLYGVEYPYPYDENNTTTEFDLSNSENAADYIVIYNYAFLVRDID
ncbi:MAG: DUF1566 domain-containing protein [Pleomorphochaeta sp.]